MKYFKNRAVPALLFRLTMTVACCALFGAVGLLAWLVNPFIGSSLGVAYPAISAQTLSNILSQSPDGQEILWEKKVIMSAAQQSPFADNMTGGEGSGKP